MLSHKCIFRAHHMREYAIEVTIYIHLFIYVYIEFALEGKQMHSKVQNLATA